MVSMLAPLAVVPGSRCRSVGHGTGNTLELQREIHFPHSLGLLYSAFTYYTGFRVNSGEYKVMGLAPYGTPRFADAIFDHLIDGWVGRVSHPQIDHILAGSTLFVEQIVDPPKHIGRQSIDA